MCWGDSLVFWLNGVQSGLVSQECGLYKCFCYSKDKDIFPFALNLFPLQGIYSSLPTLYPVDYRFIFLGELQWNRIPQLQLEWNFTVAFWKCPPWRLSLRKKGLGQFYHDWSCTASAMAPRGTFFRFSLILTLWEPSGVPGTDGWYMNEASCSDAVLYLASSNNQNF